MKNKFSIKIKGNENNYHAKTSGDLCLIMAVLSQMLVKFAIDNDVKKTKFANTMREIYEDYEKTFENKEK